ncbi:MAG: BNR/Asp-box repeat protein [Ignavibacteria bacterium]|nr:BNR/Asp-box repeat protein [Ignavibacteria bacterium]
MKTFYTILFAFCAVFLSVNNSHANWTKSNTGTVFGSKNIMSLTQNGTNIYAGTFGVGVLLSTDSGITWNYRNNGMTVLKLYSVFVDGNSIFAGTYGGGAFLSTDNGSNWTAINNGGIPSSPNTAVNTFASSGNNVFLGCSGGLWLTSNNGSNWTKSSNGLPSSIYISDIIIVENYIFLGDYYTESNIGLFLSTDNGANWTAANNGLTDKGIRALATNGTDIFAGTSTGVFLSTDKGGNWTKVSAGLTDLSIYSLTTSGSYIFAGTETGSVFFSSNKGKNWMKVSKNFTTSSIVSLAIIGTNIFSGTFGDGLWIAPLSQVTEISETPVVNSSTIVSPNPTSGLTTINYTVTEPGAVSLSIINSLGMETANLNDSQILEPGKYSLNYDVANLTPGIYFLKIITGNISETKKFVVIR